MITRPFLPSLRPQPLTPPFSPRGLWMAVSKSGNPLDIVCNVFLNCPPSVPRTVLSGSRQGSRPNVAIHGKDKREEEGVFRPRIANRVAAKQTCTTKRAPRCCESTYLAFLLEI